MDSQFIWLLILSVSTPIAGVVGFALQLRQVKKVRLENDKLQLEIEALKKSAAASEKRIVQVSTEEVVRYSYSDRPMLRLETRDQAYMPRRQLRLKKVVINSLVILFIALVLGYGIYDIYRLLIWLWPKL